MTEDYGTCMVCGLPYEWRYCEVCHGTGFVTSAFYGVGLKTCPRCNGTKGYVECLRGPHSAEEERKVILRWIDEAKKDWTW